MEDYDCDCYDYYGDSEIDYNYPIEWIEQGKLTDEQFIGALLYDPSYYEYINYELSDNVKMALSKENTFYVVKHKTYDRINARNIKRYNPDYTEEFNKKYIIAHGYEGRIVILKLINATFRKNDPNRIKAIKHLYSVRLE